MIRRYDIHAQQFKVFFNGRSIEAAYEFPILGDVTLQPQSTTVNKCWEQEPQIIH